MKKHLSVLLLFLTPLFLFGTPEEDFLSALRSSRLADASVYLRNGGNPDSIMEDGKTPLILMCQEQRSPEVRWLLEQGADPDGPDSERFTPLMRTARTGSRDIAQLLILAGAGINHQDPFGNTSLQIAVNSGQWELADYLEDRGGRIIRGYYEHPVLSEIWTRRQHYREALRLIETRWPDYPFLKAVRDGEYRQVLTLLDEGFMPEAADSEGFSVLMMAARPEEFYIGQLLLEKGADPNRENDRGLTALWYAGLMGRKELAVRLLEAGASCDGPWLENAPLFGAFAGGQYDLMNLLLDEGADPEMTGRLGASLVHYAAFLGDMRALRLLDSRGVSMRTVDADGRTALDYLVQGYNLGDMESRYLEPARFLKDKKSGYTIDPSMTGSVKLTRIITSIW